MVLTDEEIDRLLALPKRVTNPRARKRSQRGSEQLNYEVESDTGEVFKVYLRQNLKIPEGFSCGLRLVLKSGDTITLTRYNGSDHEHGNPLDGGKPLPRACHIHRATQKYMLAGRKAEHFAETTDRYSNLDGAFKALIFDCNISGFDDNFDIKQIPLL